jgi:hypothetical protein
VTEDQHVAKNKGQFKQIKQFQPNIRMNYELFFAFGKFFSALFTLLVRALPPGAKWNQSFAVGENKNVQ